MDNEDIDCVACSYPINFNQKGGFTVCGHGNIHYNCSYLGIKCGICGSPLMFDVNQSENDFLSFSMNRRDEDDRCSEGSEVFNMLSEIKELLLEQKAEQAKQTKMIEELKEEIKDFKNKEKKIQELQNDILQMKYDKIVKDHKELEAKLNKLSAED